MTGTLFALSVKNSLEQRDRLCKGGDRWSKAKHTFTRERLHFYGTIRVRDTLRSRTTTMTTTTTTRVTKEKGRGEKGARLPGRSAVCLFSSLYWQSLGNSPGDARAELLYRVTSGSHFVTAGPPIQRHRSLRTHYRSEINFPASIFPPGAFEGGRVRLRIVSVFRYDAPAPI